MMEGKFREYNWNDILTLILNDAGLKGEEDQRQRGETWYVGSFDPPEHAADTCIRIKIYDKPYGVRIQEHTRSVSDD